MGKPEPKSSHFRTDIQGLRAVAVLVVFADHMFGWPAGGFLGVDVFFVISGFLITGLLLREYDKTGRISFAKFYTGRIKRIVPSATVVLIFTIGFSFALFTLQRAVGVTWDAFWAFVFGANWNFAAAGTDYFQQGGAVSPLQHYWSLSVEEQFYFVWPWLLLGLLALFARFGTMTSVRARFIAGSSIGVISVASFGWAMIQSTSSPTVAYFSTFTRGWELGLGALVAICAPLFTRIPTMVRPVLSYVGLAGIFASCFLITSKSVWPAPTALLPVAATMLVIIAGIGEQPRNVWLLTNPVSVFVGNISYSLYLWHFPVIIFGHALYPNAGEGVYVGIAFVGFALAIAQYYAIEKPIWKSPLWVKRSRRDSAPWRTWRKDNAEQMKYGYAAGFVTLVLAVVGVAFVPTQSTPTIAEPAPTSQPSGTPSTTPAVDATRGEVIKALNASTWPSTLAPSIDQLGPDSKVTAWITDGCLSLERGSEKDPSATVSRCVYGKAGSTERIAIVGDSIAISWLPAVQAAFPESEIHVMTMQQCPFASVSVNKNDNSALPECDDFHALTKQKVSDLKPAVTLVAQAENSEPRRTGDRSMVDGLVDSLTSYAAVSGKVIVLPPPPQGPPVTECFTSAGRPSDCVSTVSKDHSEAVSVLKSAVGKVPGTRFVDTDVLFCASGKCSSMIANVIVRADRAHLTQEYSAYLGPSLRELVKD